MNTDLWAKVQRHLARVSAKGVDYIEFFANKDNVGFSVLETEDTPTDDSKLILFNTLEALESYLDGLEGEK